MAKLGCRRGQGEHAFLLYFVTLRQRPGPAEEDWELTLVVASF